MLFHVNKISHCPWPKKSVEIEIASTRLTESNTELVFHNFVSTRTPLCIICRFPQTIQAWYASPGETSIFLLPIRPKIETEKIVQTNDCENSMRGSSCATEAVLTHITA